MHLVVVGWCSSGGLGACVCAGGLWLGLASLGASLGWVGLPGGLGSLVWFAWSSLACCLVSGVLSSLWFGVVGSPLPGVALVFAEGDVTHTLAQLRCGGSGGGAWGRAGWLGGCLGSRGLSRSQLCPWCPKAPQSGMPWGCPLSGSLRSHVHCAGPGKNCLRCACWR